MGEARCYPSTDVDAYHLPSQNGELVSMINIAQSYTIVCRRAYHIATHPLLQRHSEAASHDPLESPDETPSNPHGGTSQP